MVEETEKWLKYTSHPSFYKGRKYLLGLVPQAKQSRIFYCIRGKTRLGTGPIKQLPPVLMLRIVQLLQFFAALDYQIPFQLN